MITVLTKEDFKSLNISPAENEILYRDTLFERVAICSKKNPDEVEKLYREYSEKKFQYLIVDYHFFILVWLQKTKTNETNDNSANLSSGNVDNKQVDSSKETNLAELSVSTSSTVEEKIGDEGQVNCEMSTASGKNTKAKIIKKYRGISYEVEIPDSSSQASSENNLKSANKLRKYRGQIY